MTLDDLDEISVLGQGTYGRVTLVRDKTGGPTMALKQIQKGKLEPIYLLWITQQNTRLFYFCYFCLSTLPVNINEHTIASGLIFQYIIVTP